MQPKTNLLYALLICSLIGLQQCNSLQGLSAPSRTSSTTPKGGSSTTNMQRDIVDFALDLQGKPYKYGGRSPRTGFDCSGFTHYVMGNFGYDLTPVSRVQESEGQKIRLADAKAGDLIFFRRSAASSVFHVALVISNDREGLKVVHSTSSKGVRIDNVTTNSYWKGKVSTARRVLR